MKKTDEEMGRKPKVDWSVIQRPLETDREPRKLQLFRSDLVRSAKAISEYRYIDVVSNFSVGHVVQVETALFTKIMFQKPGTDPSIHYCC